MLSSVRRSLASIIVSHMTPLRRLGLFLVTISVISGTSASAQTVTEWSTESRITLAFHVNDAALQRLLPSGWTSAPSTDAGSPGANLTVTFVERHLALDGQGQPFRTGTSRYIVFVVPARNAAGEANRVVVTGLSPEGAGAYGVNLTAAVSTVTRSSTAQAEEGGRAEEHWEFAAASGERIDLRVAYRRARPVKSHAEMKLRSARRPEFTRTYKVDQAADVVRSASTPDRVESLTFRASGPAFAPLFDGKETLLSVTSLPWYMREISVP
jgi:hypothetical protein